MKVTTIPKNFTISCKFMQCFSYKNSIFCIFINGNLKIFIGFVYNFEEFQLEFRNVPNLTI